MGCCEDIVETMNRIALITGAGRGIGARIARQFALQGYDLALTSRDGKSAEQVASELRREGKRAVGLAANASDPPFAAAAIEKTVAEYGRLDVLVNNDRHFQP